VLNHEIQDADLGLMSTLISVGQEGHDITLSLAGIIRSWPRQRTGDWQDEGRNHIEMPEAVSSDLHT